MEPVSLIGVGLIGAGVGSTVIHVWNKSFYSKTDKATVLQQQLNQANLLIEQRRSNDGVLSQLQSENTSLKQEIENHRHALNSGSMEPGRIQDALAEIEMIKLNRALLEQELHREKTEKSKAIEAIEALVNEKYKLSQEFEQKISAMASQTTEINDSQVKVIQEKLASSEAQIVTLRQRETIAMGELERVKLENQGLKESGQNQVSHSFEIQTLTRQLEDAQSQLQALKVSAIEPLKLSEESTESVRAGAELNAQLRQSQQELNFVIAERDELIAENAKLESSLGSRDELSQKLIGLEKDSQALAAAKALANANDVKVRVLEQEIELLRNRLGDSARMEIEFAEIKQKASLVDGLQTNLSSQQEIATQSRLAIEKAEAELEIERSVKRSLESTFSEQKQAAELREAEMKSRLERLREQTNQTAQDMEAKMQSQVAQIQESAGARESEFIRIIQELEASVAQAQVSARNSENIAAIKERLQAVSEESAAYKSALATAYAQMSSLKTKLVTLAATAQKDNLNQIPGINMSFQNLLQDSGILTFKDLAFQSPERILDIIGGQEIILEEAEQWISAAKRMA